MQNSLSNLYKRCLYLERKKKICICGIDKIHLQEISDKLNLILPCDFTEINEHSGYMGFPTMEFSEIANNRNYIVEDNERLRKWYSNESQNQSDMSHILVLADDDGGSVFMITQDSPEKPTPVIWCDYGDMYYYSIHKKFQYPHDEWPSFTAFFEYLIEQEEKALEAGKE